MRCSEALTLFLRLLLVVLLFNGCSGLFRSKPSWPRPEPREAGPGIITTDDYVILITKEGDTLRSLAERFLGNAEQAWVIADFNHVRRLTPGQEVVVPLTAKNPIGVYTDGYQTVPILSYHRFGHQTGKMVVSPEAFETQMAYLKAQDYRVIPLADLLAFLDGQTRLPRRAVVITIDDGYKSAYTTAYPILKRYDFPATVFIYSNFIGARLGLSWREMQEMVASELIDIQPHSKAHSNLGLKKLAEDNTTYMRRVEQEIRFPASQITQRLHLPVHTFAYPFGATTDFVIARVKQHQYRMGVVAYRGGNPFFADPFMLRRSMIYGEYGMKDFKKNLEVFHKVKLLSSAPSDGPSKTPRPTLVATLSRGPRGGRALASRLAARRLRAVQLEQQGDLAAASIQWEILRALDPDNAAVDRQLTLLHERIRQGVEDHMRLGVRAVKHQDFERAQREFLTVLALDPLQTRPRTYLRNLEQDRLKAVQRAKLARLSKAQQQTRMRQVHTNHQPPRTAKTQATSESDQLDVALTDFRQGNYATSIRVLRTALIKHPEDTRLKLYLAEAHFQLARRLYEQGNLAEARAHFEAARKTYPSKIPQINLYLKHIKQQLATTDARHGR
jgi:peptidoglycan/xylan/chitin deacetylase (PgdA/CDA1 family)/TolA-binding protein